jgi:hypothetical protein
MQGPSHSLFMSYLDPSVELLKSNLHALARRADSANTLAAILAARLAEQRREIEALRTCLSPAEAGADVLAPEPDTEPHSIISPYD